jgi:hypothetical protein
MSNKKRRRPDRLDAAMAAMCRALDQMERDTGGDFHFTLTWQPVKPKPRPEKDKP